MSQPVIRADGKQIIITRPDKVLYPDDGITKQQIANYYLEIAPKMLPYLKNRPVVLQRWPDGINKQGFYQKEASDYFPKWIKTVSVNLVKGGKQHLVVVDSIASLIYLANQAALTFHIWTSTTDNLKNPDRMVFDLDPSTANFAKVINGALVLRKSLLKRSYKPWLMTTGSRGLHLVVPLQPNRTFAAIKAEAQTIAAEAAAMDKNLTAEIRKSQRHKRIYIDIARNGYGQTQVAPYSLRALPGAPIAMPLNWSDLNTSLEPQAYKLASIIP